MLPSLPDIKIYPPLPVYIHKIDSPTVWKSDDDIQKRVNNALARIFKDPEHIYSFWRVESELDFYCIAASLNAGRSSASEAISFIWVTEEELDSFGVDLPKPSAEGVCLYARQLHYNVSMNRSQAQRFCFELMTIGRESSKCTKSQMRLIVEHLTEKGCKVYSGEPDTCSCTSCSPY